MAKKYYNGNTNLPAVGEKRAYTKFQLEEIAKCKKDPIYFIESYCKINALDYGVVDFVMWDFQKDLIKTIFDNRKVVVKIGRQMSKTTCAAAVILWHTIFEDKFTTAILANKKATAIEVLDRIQMMFEYLPEWMKHGVKTYNKGDIELENGSKIFTASTTPSGIRGKSCNFLYVDEAAIIPNTIAELFFAAVFPVISSGSTTKVLITSTPLGYNHFWKLWNDAENDINGFVPFTAHYSAHPDRDEKWIEEQYKILGDVKFNQEILCEFLGSSNTLISGKTLATLSATPPVYSREGYDVLEEPNERSVYTIVCDVSRGVREDYSAFVVIDISDVPYKTVAKYRSNEISPLLYPNVIHTVAKSYNDAYVLVEINDIGGQVVDILVNDLEYENILYTVKYQQHKSVSLTNGMVSKSSAAPGVRTDKKVKRVGCSILKNLIEEKKLIITDINIIEELSVFIEKNGSYTADDGYHDDLVMPLVLFAWMTTNNYFKDMTDQDVRRLMYQKRMDEISSHLSPFGGVLQSGDTVEKIDTIFSNYNNPFNDNSLWISVNDSYESFIRNRIDL